MKSAIRKNKYWDEKKLTKEMRDEYFKQTGLKLGRILIPNKKLLSVCQKITQ